MSVTLIRQAKSAGLGGAITTLTAFSSLAGLVYFYWYIDGRYAGVSSGAGSGSFSFAIQGPAQARVEVLDSADPPEIFAPGSQSPEAWPATRTIAWTRSLDGAAARYLVEQQQGAGSWQTLAYVNDDPAIWQYAVVTPRLADLTSYAWRVTALDSAGGGGGGGGGGNPGTPLAIAAELIVRTPDAPDFAIAFDPATTKVTFSEAS